MAGRRAQRGVVTRHPGDWNAANMYFASEGDTLSSGQFSGAGLINTDDQGRYLVVWAYSVSMQLAGTNINASNANCVSGPLTALPGGALLNTCDNINLAMAPSAAQQWYATDFPLDDESGFISQEGPGVQAVASPFPLLVLPVGSIFAVSFNVTSGSAGLAWSLSLMFEMTPQYN